ncbi:hypothetical protein ACP70R_048323 [Stipagrostis hirtigluma subsp. patula]
MAREVSGPKVPVAMEEEEASLRKRIAELSKRQDDVRLARRDIEISLIIAELRLRRRQSVDDLPPDVVADLHEELVKRAKVLADRLNLLCSEATAAPPPPPPPPASSAVAPAVGAAKGQDGGEPM